jgi:ribose transport system ATP-binding protein
MRGIDKSFSGIPALRQASLSVAAGEVHALVGQNGAGKSTLIKVLPGAVRRDSGEIAFAGRPIAFSSPQDAQAGGISTIFQEINLIPYRSVAENIFLGRERYRFGVLDWRRMHREAAALLRRFRVAIDVGQPLNRYTIAIQQMVAIARAVSFAARLVIMDEPTSSLDDGEVAVLFDTIRQLRAEGVGVVFVSHKLDELYAVCDRVTIMRDGRTVATSAMADISKLQLVATMLGRDLDSVRQGATGFARHHQPAAGTAPVLQAEELRAGRRVRGVSLSVGAGEIVGLAGLLGSGRSETARAIFGADRLDSGSLRVNGQPATITDPQAAIAAGLGFCAEDRKAEGIVPEMSVRENLTLALLPRLARAGVIDTVRQRAIVERFIARLGIKTAGPEQRIRELSCGNQQKVLLARWLCMDPKLLILDEPTRGIDVGAKAEIQSLIEELAGGGLGVLMISSELDELVEGCSRVVVLRDGESVAELSGERMDEGAVLQAMAHGAGLVEAADV